MRLFRRTVLFDAFEADRQRNQQNHGNDDDENRTPWQNARHRATHGRADGGRHGDDERTDAHQSSDLAAWGLFENDVHHQRCGHAGADALDDAGY